MNEELPNSAHLSQIETFAAPLRVVLLGASNLSMSFPKVVELARATSERPAEFFVAMGFGRSYGQESKFFRKKFSGILQSGIWEALERTASRATVAILADVGNDIGYDTPVETILEWVNETLDRLARHGARVALNNLPIESLRSVGSLRYSVMRRILFPSCRLSRGALLERVERLSESLGKIAAERKIPVFSGELAWYGIDPIHPRRARAGEIWQRMIGALEPERGTAKWVAPARDDARQLRRLQAESWAQAADAASAAPPRAKLADGTTLELF